MNKLIDKAVFDLKGKFPSPLKQFNTLYWSNGGTYFGGDDVSIHKVICSRDEFNQRARELGWINGYKYGVVYETNGKKPDLKDHVIVEFKNKSHGPDNWVRIGEVNSINWSGVYGAKDTPNPVTSFRVVDQRYKPKDTQMPEQLGNYEQLDNSWFERGELPPVDVEIEYSLDGDMWHTCKVMHYGCHKVFIKSHKANSEGDKEYCISKWDSVFRPIKTEREKFIEAANKIYYTSVDVDHFIEKMYEAGFRAPGNE